MLLSNCIVPTSMYKCVLVVDCRLGYPDSTYLARVKQKLNEKGIFKSLVPLSKGRVWRYM